MKKEIIRREAIKLRIVGKRYSVISLLLHELYGYEVNLRTIKRWYKRFQEEDWDFKSKSTKPKKIYYKFALQDKEEVIKIRKLTGWDSKRIKKILESKGIFMSKSYVEQIIREAHLQRDSKMKGIRLKWVRWQREHPNSLWQIDASGDENHGWILPAIDDCSRFCVGIEVVDKLDTDSVTKFLESRFKIHGKPREILTDNGPEYKRMFDKWCNKFDIIYIRTALHKPTTVGKVERFHQTIDKELPYCNNDLEMFRYRYNHIRPHWSLNLLTPAQVYFAFHKLF